MSEQYQRHGMELRTTFKIDPSPDGITYNDKTMFVGSCFASSMGSMMEAGKMPVMINPAGTVFNPVSVINTLDTIMAGEEFTREDLHFHDGMWLSFLHYTDFSSEDPLKVLDRINNKLKEALAFLRIAKFLFITFGTARVYRWKKSGQIVSNCHKIPAEQFTTELLSVSEIAESWKQGIDRLHTINPDIRLIFTISPVRHWKDGAHGNQVSKSVLFLAVEELLKHSPGVQYFPAYELVMDDLRDYRFYCDDMIHPSTSAIAYIWKMFTETYFDAGTIRNWNEIMKITKACGHRFTSDNIAGRKRFAEKMLREISLTESRIPSVDFSGERQYFSSLAGN